MLFKDDKFLPSGTQSLAISDKTSEKPSSERNSFNLKVHKVDENDGQDKSSDDGQEDQTPKEHAPKASSRYYENFEEMELLGKGASGEVYKVR
mgnify:FL=1|jgi:hypothetical protein